MAQRTAFAAWQRFGARELCRVALWGIAAAAALLLAMFAATSDAGRDRLALAMSKIPGVAQPGQTQPEARPPDNTRKLADAVQSLAIDRDRLAARLDTLERSVGEITGSIRQRPPASAAPQPGPVPPMPMVATPEVAPTAPLATARLATAPTPMELSRQEFGIDLGGAANVDGLRALWSAARTKHGGLLEGLRPIVTIRENARPGGGEPRLVVGPFANAAAAARLCSLIAISGATCQPAVFVGQRLASH